jgi:TRAP-type C4-dicarboxylate transport system permease small subunit
MMRIAALREGVVRAIHYTAAALLIAAVVVMAMQVALRLVFNAPLSWPEEAVRYAFVWVVYLGSVVAVTSDSHIRVLVAIEDRGPTIMRLSDVLSWILNVLSFAFLLYWGIDLAVTYKDAEFYTLPGWSQLWYYLALPVCAGMALAFLVLPGQRSGTSKPPGESPL